MLRRYLMPHIHTRSVWRTVRSIRCHLSRTFTVHRTNDRSLFINMNEKIFLLLFRETKTNWRQIIKQADRHMSAIIPCVGWLWMLRTSKFIDDRRDIVSILNDARFQFFPVHFCVVKNSKRIDDGIGFAGWYIELGWGGGWFVEWMRTAYTVRDMCYRCIVECRQWLERLIGTKWCEKNAMNQILLHILKAAPTL